MPSFELWVYDTETNLPVVKKKLEQSGIPYRLVQNRWISSFNNPHHAAMCEIEVDSERDGKKLRAAIGYLSHQGQKPGVYKYLPSKRYLTGQYLKKEEGPRSCATREVSMRQIMAAYEESKGEW